MLLKEYQIISKNELKEVTDTIMLSFSGGGLIGLCYHLGVIEYLYKKNILTKNRIIALGASAGSWAAMVSLYLQFKLKKKDDNFSFYKIKLELYKFIINLKTNNLMKFPVNCKPLIYKFCNFFFEDDLETNQFLQFIKNKLFISITEHKQYLQFKNILINPTTKDNLIESLIDSSKLGIFIGSIVSAIAGYIILSSKYRSKG